MACTWIAGIRRTDQGRRRFRAITIAVARDNAGDAIPSAGPKLALRALGVLAATAIAVAGSVLLTGRGRAGGANQGIVGFHPRGKEGTDTERRGQIAGLARLPAGRGATNPVSAEESSLALIIAATGFGLSLGFADRARWTCTGRPDI